MKRTLTILLLLPACLACEEKVTDATPVLERAMAAMGGRDALDAVESVYLRLEGTFRAPESPTTDIPYVQEVLLTLPDRLAVRVEVAGIKTTKAVNGKKVWVRSGAAVDDPVGGAAAEERADRDDLIALLIRPLLTPPFTTRPKADGVAAARPDEVSRTILFDSETGLPSRIVRTARGARGKTGNLIRTFADWQPRGGILFPRTLTVALGGGRLDLEATVVEFNPKNTHGLSPDRPSDRRSIQMGEIERVREPGGNFLAARQKGNYLTLAKVDVLIRQGLNASYARPKGPIRRIFDQFPDDKGIAIVTTLVPVQFDRDPRARHLPRGVKAVTLNEVEALALKFTGPYPQDDSIEKILINYGKDLGLEPLEPARYLVLSDPETGDPADLEQEIRLPVRKRE